MKNKKSDKENVKRMFLKKSTSYVTGMAVMVFLSCLLVGCGVEDKALEIPLMQEKEVLAESAAISLTDALQEEDFAKIQNDSVVPTENVTMIYVHVCGAVNWPGVVSLPKGSRAEEALLAAGGFREDAQRDYVNLAAMVEDGQQLYFPTMEEAVLLQQQEYATENGLVNINTADEEQLCTLPGIGESRAQDIINYREKQGAFQKKEDIMKVSGIKQNAYDKLCDRITVE